MDSKLTNMVFGLLIFGACAFVGAKWVLRKKVLPPALVCPSSHELTLTDEVRTYVDTHIVSGPKVQGADFAKIAAELGDLETRVQRLQGIAQHFTDLKGKLDEAVKYRREFSKIRYQRVIKDRNLAQGSILSEVRDKCVPSSP